MDDLIAMAFFPLTLVLMRCGEGIRSAKRIL